jgi:DNA replication protein DnaC
MAAQATHLRDIATLSPEELAQLQAAHNQAARRRGNPVPLSLVLAPPPQATPALPRSSLGELSWCCPGCSRTYSARRCQGRCDACQAQALAAALQHKRQQIHDRAIEPAGHDFRQTTLDHPQLSAWVKSPLAIAKARKRAELNYDEPHKAWSFMLLLGGTGVGKTTLGTAVFRSLADRVLAPGATTDDEAFVGGMYWIPAVELARSQRETSLGKPIAKVERAVNATVLMLDDLGQEAPSDKDNLVYVLTERQRYQRPTIVTCGCETKSLEARYGAHLLRRLTERAHVLFLGSSGVDEAAQREGTGGVCQERLP